jgi:hypothetical protein
MAYVSKWGLMSPVCESVMMAAGLSKDGAQNDICRAINDGVINIQVTLRKHATKPMYSSEVLEGKLFQIPTPLRPEDFDWDQSRPVNPWFVRRETYSLPGYWHVEKIELCVTDVMNALCAAARPGGPGEHVGSEAGAASRSGPDPVSPSRRSQVAAGSARRRGARPRKFEQASGAMRDDLRQGRRTLAELKTMLEKNLEATYGVSRDTARKARNAVLAEFGEN